MTCLLLHASLFNSLWYFTWNCIVGFHLLISLFFRAELRAHSIFHHFSYYALCYSCVVKCYVSICNEVSQKQSLLLAPWVFHVTSIMHELISSILQWSIATAGCHHFRSAHEKILCNSSFHVWCCVLFWSDCPYLQCIVLTTMQLGSVVLTHQWIAVNGLYFLNQAQHENDKASNAGHS